MNKLSNIDFDRIFYYFNKLCAIPHGSGNMNKISEYCLEFAKEKTLKAIRDDANNVIIYKNASKGYENKQPIILQGHLDMVCQADENIKINFDADPIKTYIDGDYLKADGTTLGADNGIAVAMILAILESDSYPHPPIEAVFTTDEEIGMIGAGKLDFKVLSGKRMINIDAEDPKTITVSCAGGSDFIMYLPICKKPAKGKKATLSVKGLKGGHSGIEINKGRINANLLMGRILNEVSKNTDFEIISINGGNKANAIPRMSNAEILVYNEEEFNKKLDRCIDEIRKEINEREKNFSYNLAYESNGEYEIISAGDKEKLIYSLLCVPNGVVDMSVQIENLVETSLNLGILKTLEEKVMFHFALRSNKESALYHLEERLKLFAKNSDFEYEAFGHYPPWEFKDKSKLQELYINEYNAIFNKNPEVVAIHAGLECGLFASNIKDFDCIAIGPEILDAHTTSERLKISSAKEIFCVLLNVLNKCD